MTGSAEAAQSVRTSWLAKLGSMQRRYVAVDGGTGAHLLAALSGADVRLRAVASPRHADLLIVVEPISQSLAPALLEYARALPQPAQALIIDTAAWHPALQDGAIASDVLPGTPQVDARSAAQIIDIIQRLAPWPHLRTATEPAFTEATIALPNKQERELATELAVLSLGPIQSLTGGPLRLLLICDGEQVLQAQVEAGFARRGIAEAMVVTSWQEAARLAAALDPLAPVAGRLVYVQALEQLQQQPASAACRASRQAALAVERAGNHLWWLHRFLTFLAAPEPAARAWQAAASVEQLAGTVWQQPTAMWLAPQQAAPSAQSAAAAALQRLAGQVRSVRQRLTQQRFLEPRLRGVGVLSADVLRSAGVSGPLLQAAEHGAGDAWSRLQTRLLAAADDLEAAARVLSVAGSTVAHETNQPESDWQVPAGEADVAVTGPRGELGLHLVSDGGSGPTRVEWRRPSAAVLPLLPAALTGQKLVDAETLVASLDLAMAEADG